MAANVKQGDWYDAIGSRCKQDRATVKEVLARHEVRPSPTINVPRRVSIQCLRFVGSKSGKHEGPFEFNWSGLEPGIWGLISDRNLKGKSSVLEIIKWLLRGKPSSKLQEGVRSWMSEIRLDFLIDQTPHRVWVSQKDKNLSGNLVRNAETAKEQEIAQFQSEDDFEACMSSFMMKELSLDRLTAWRSPNTLEKTGKAVIHDWPALSGALFIGADYAALFGETIYDGLNTALMQMYLGLPWVPTLAKLRTLVNEITSEGKVKSSRTADEEARRKTRRQEIEERLTELSGKLAQWPSDEKIKAALKLANDQQQSASQEIRQINSALVEAHREHEEATYLHLEDQRDRQNFLEAKAANAVFKRLDPTCCPHCETSITEDRRKKEQKDHTCSVCGEPIFESADSELMMKELDERAEASARALKDTQTLLRRLETQLTEFNAQKSEAEADCKRLEAERRRYEERDDLKQQVAVQEALLKEYDLPSEPSEDEDISETDLKVIRAALKETKSRVDDIQVSLLARVSEIISELAEKFGMEAVTSARLTGNPFLHITKDGIETTYSKCTDGEKLRLKVAAIIAIMSVAEERHVGRHPGLLLIDSPGAEEMVESDVDRLVGGLVSITEKLPHLQVFVAATASDSILRHIAPDRRRHAKGDAFLW